MNNKTRKVPELRFKTFNENWSFKKLGNLCKTNTGSLNANAMVENGKYRFYTCAKNYFKINSYAFDTNAILVSGNGAHVGYVHHYDGKFNAYQRTYVLDGFEKDIIFIKYYLNKNLPTRIDNLKKNGNTPYITKDVLTEMFISIPSKKEQNRIASFLSNVDKKIKLMEQIQNLRKQYKKGLLQGLFVGGGGLNVPSLRFKGFDKDWKTVKIADLFTFFKGKGVSKKDIMNDGKNKVVLYGEINTTYNWKVNSVESKTNLSKENLVLGVGNQLLFPSSGYVPTTMVCPVSLNESGVIISGDTNILTPLKGYSDFLALVFQANKQELSKIVQGTTARHLYNKDLSFGSIVITEELKEQERIISFLFNTDKQIENCDLNLEFLRSWKVGLLQRMFV